MELIDAVLIYFILNYLIVFSVNIYVPIIRKIKTGSIFEKPKAKEEKLTLKEITNDLLNTGKLVVLILFFGIGATIFYSAYLTVEKEIKEDRMK